jgi:hypothetical protein
VHLELLATRRWRWSTARPFRAAGSTLRYPAGRHSGINARPDQQKDNLESLRHGRHLLLALPCHAQINAETLKQDGVAACLLKPLTATRLLPALTASCRRSRYRPAF